MHDEHDLLAQRFEEHRPRLRAVAHRMLGSPAEADDALQESWLRISRADTEAVENMGGWLTTVVARVCLNMLRSRESRREDPLDSHVPREDGRRQTAGGEDDAADPERQAVLADSVGLALLVVLDTLKPAERLAFVLHDLFDLPFDEIAPIVDKSPATTRQLASRARRRVRGAEAKTGDLTGDLAGKSAGEKAEEAASGAGAARRREVVDAFLAASRGGDFDALLALLDPDAVLRVDAKAAQWGTDEASGATAVARAFTGRATGARTALIDGVTGLVWAPGGTPRVVIGFTITDAKITAIDVSADPGRLGSLDVEFLDG